MNLLFTPRLRCVLMAAFVMAACSALRAAERWYTYRDCRLIEHPYNDGDSFHVRTKSAEFIFRLYFVDAPECDASYPDRVNDQAKYWAVDTNRVLEIGRAAADFTRRFLAGAFTVRSKREDARGQSDRPRFYALVETGAGDLGEALVAQGLARVHGVPTSLPDGTPPEVVLGRLRGLERAAKTQRLGGWQFAPSPGEGSASTSTKGAPAGLRRRR